MEVFYETQIFSSQWASSRRRNSRNCSIHSCSVSRIKVLGPLAPQTPNQPPAVAIAACKGKEVGTPCQFQIPQGRTIEGTCKTVKTQFLCLPDNLPNQGAPNQGN